MSPGFFFISSIACSDVTGATRTGRDEEKTRERRCVGAKPAQTSLKQRVLIDILEGLWWGFLHFSTPLSKVVALPLISWILATAQK